MDRPALQVAIAMVGIAALAMFVGLVIIGLLWQARPTEPVAAPEPVGDPVVRLPRQRSRGGSALLSQRMRLGAYAVSAAERAAQARTVAEALRQLAVQALAARDEAWSTLEAVDELPVPGADAADGPTVDPVVTQAAFAAFRRGELTVDELRRVWSRPEELDPALATRESERRERMALARAARLAYEQAAAKARRTEEQAQVAEVAATALASEAEEAAREASATSGRP